MKWIGQHIWDKISRFRNDVYIQLDETAQDHVVGVDANGKLYKQDVATGDITGVTITTDSGGGSAASDTGGSADFSILGSSGVGVTNSGTTITAVAVPGEIDHDSLLNFASNEHFTQANITTVGTIGTGVWQGTAIASAYLDSDTAHWSGGYFTGAVTFQNSVFFDNADPNKPLVQIKNTNSGTTSSLLYFVKDKGAAGADGDDICTFLFTSDNSAQEQISFAQIVAEVGTAADTDEAGKLTFQIAASNGTTSNLRNAFVLTGHGTNDIVDVGIGYGATSTTTIAGDLDIDGDTITTAGNIELATGGSGNITLDSAGDIALECGGGDLTCDADTVTFSSSNADDPKLVLQNNTNDAQGARFQIKKSRVTGGGAQGNNDNIAEIDFFGEDNGENQAQYAKILVKTNEVTDGQESGDMRFQVAAHDASLTQGLKLVGGSEDGEVDVTIAAGTASVTTITGDLTISGSDLTFDSVALTAIQTSGETFADNDTSIMTSAAIDDKINTKYASSTISFTGQATMLSSGNWVMPGKPGISSHTWNKDISVNTETNDSTTAAIPRQWGHAGVRMPSACIIDGISCAIINASGNRQVTLGLFFARASDSTNVDWGTTNDIGAKLQIHADANNESGSYSNRPSHAEVTGSNIAMAAGDMFYPAIKLTGVTSGGNTDNIYASFTVHVKTLIS